MSQKHERVNFALLGKKLGMTQFFREDGIAIPCTVVEVGPCTVVQKKTKDKDGYTAVQLGFADKKKQRINKAEAGHFASSKSPVKKFIKEVRVTEDEINEYEVGQSLTADLFKEGDKVDVQGTSIGKGFQGVMKRHNFGGSATCSHGTHEFFRHGGSIGMGTNPGRVLKGKKMPGHMGNETVTVQNLTVAAVEADKNYVLIKGAVPGAKNAFVKIKASVKGGFEKRSVKAAEEKTEEAPAAEEK